MYINHYRILYGILEPSASLHPLDFHVGIQMLMRLKIIFDLVCIWMAGYSMVWAVTRAKAHASSSADSVEMSSEKLSVTGP